MHSAGVLAAGVAGGVAFPAEIKEHGLVELRAWFFVKDPVVLKSTIFADNGRDVFGVRILTEPGLRLAELPLSTIKAVVASPGRVEKCLMTAWDDERKEGLMEVVSRDGKLVFAIPGQLDQTPRPGPAWLDLSDVRQVL